MSQEEKVLKYLVIPILTLILLPLGAVLHKIGQFDSDVTTDCIAIEGDVAYVLGYYYSGLEIIDISDLESPFRLTYYPCNSAQSIAVVGNRAYLAGAGLEILDVTNPQQPIPLGSCAVPGGDIIISGNYAYVADYSSGLYIVDISDSNNPIQVGSFATNGIRSLAISNGYAYLAVYWDGLQILNISDPQNPTFVGSYNTPGLATGVAVSGNIACIADYGDGLQIFDISNPYFTSLIGTIDLPGASENVTLYGDMAYVSANYYGLHVIDLSYPQTPTLIGSYDTPGDARLTVFRDGIAYVGDWSGLQIIDVSNPQNPALLSFLDTPGSGLDLAVSGDIACVADGSSDLLIYNISDTQNPFLTGSLDLNQNNLNTIKTVTISGNIAYLTGICEVSEEYYTSRLWLVDLSNPSEPSLLGFYGIAGDGYSVQIPISVIDSIAYITVGNSLYILNVADPQNPVLLSLSTIQVSRPDICVANGIAYITSAAIDWYGPDPGLLVYNVSNPQTPFLLGSLDTPDRALGVVVTGGVAYVAGGESGVQIINVSDPTLPVQVGSIIPHATGWVNLCRIFDNRLFISDTNWNEISIYDLSSPLTPQLIQRYDWSLPANELCASGNALYTINGYYGLYLHNLGAVDSHDPVQISPSAFALRNYPNPFNPETLLAYTLSSPGTVSLAIYNSRGQRVRSLLNDQQAAGEHTLSWNGTDDSGRGVASGLYLCRIACEGKQETRKLLLLK